MNNLWKWFLVGVATFLFGIGMLLMGVKSDNGGTVIGGETEAKLSDLKVFNTALKAADIRFVRQTPYEGGGSVVDVVFKGMWIAGGEREILVPGLTDEASLKLIETLKSGHVFEIESPLYGGEIEHTYWARYGTDVPKARVERGRIVIYDLSQINWIEACKVDENSGLPLRESRLPDLAERIEETMTNREIPLSPGWVQKKGAD